MTYYIPVTVEVLRRWRRGSDPADAVDLAHWISNLDALDSMHRGEWKWPEHLYACAGPCVTDATLGLPGEITGGTRTALEHAGYFGTPPVQRQWQE